MTSFRPAVRENVSLLIGLAGGTGSGKTMSAMRLATGLAGGERFAVIDTESGRARHYADEYHFDVADLAPPFTPAAYLEAVKAAEKAGYPVIVVDSASHEHAGDGGLLDMHDEEMHRMGDRESAKMAAWIKPKQEHKRFVTHLLQIRSHLILCFRAEQKIEMVKDAKGKWEIVPKRSLVGLDGWQPISEKSLPYELTVSLLLTADAPGVPKPIKVPEKLRGFFPAGSPIDESAGIALAEWAAGNTDPYTTRSRELIELSERYGLDMEKVRAKIGEHAPDLKWLERSIETLQKNVEAKIGGGNPTDNTPAGPSTSPEGATAAPEPSSLFQPPTRAQHAQASANRAKGREPA